MVQVEAPVPEDFQVDPVDIHLVVRLVAPGYQEVLVDNLADRGNLVVIHLAGRDHRDFQVGVQEELNQVGRNPKDFHQARDLLVDIRADDHRFHFRAVNQQVGDIPVADQVAKDQVGFQVVRHQAEDIPVGKLLEVIPADRLPEVIPVHRSLVVQELDILVEGQVLAIQEVLRDLAVVQVLRDQVGIQDQEDPADLKVLEVSKVQVERLPVVTLVLDQVLKDQEAIQVGQVYKNQMIKLF